MLKTFHPPRSKTQLCLLPAMLSLLLVLSCTQEPSPPTPGTCSQALDAKSLKESISDGLEYILNSQNKNGSFQSELRVSDLQSAGQFQETEQAQILWLLTRLYKNHKSEKLETAINLAFSFFRKHSVQLKPSIRVLKFPASLTNGKESELGDTRTIAYLLLAYIDYLESNPKALELDQNSAALQEAEEYFNLLLRILDTRSRWPGNYQTRNGSGLNRAKPRTTGAALLAIVRSIDFFKRPERTAVAFRVAQSGYERLFQEAIQKKSNTTVTRQFLNEGHEAYYQIASSKWRFAGHFSTYVIDLADWAKRESRTFTEEGDTRTLLEALARAYETANKVSNSEKASPYLCEIDALMGNYSSWQQRGESKDLRGGVYKSNLRSTTSTKATAEHIAVADRLLDLVQR